MEKSIEAVRHLYAWVPMMNVKYASKLTEGAYFTKKDKYGLNDEDPKIPFLTESFLYNLLGKEDARTLLALLRQAFESVGIDVNRLDLRDIETEC
jgi:hypothetical protein